MVQMADPIFRALEDIGAQGKRLLYMSPRGKILDEEMIREFSREEELVILCGHYEGVDQRILDEWKAKEPPSSGDWDAQRSHDDWQKRMWFLEDRYRWAEGDRYKLHLMLFEHFTHNWYEPALAGLTPEQRLEARLSLLRRANVDPGAMESLGDTARAAYRLETHARERELAPGAPGAD